MTILPLPVDTVTRHLINHLDQALPGKLTAFYLVGSVALKDFQVGKSDIDFVAVLAPSVDLAALARVHVDLAYVFPDIDCDGIYLDIDDLSRSPFGKGLSVRTGQLAMQSADERHPVTWLLLSDNGIALRGRSPDATWIAADREAAIHYSRENLQTYWRPWLNTRRRSKAGADRPLSDEEVVWGTLGVARLYATIMSGKVASKSSGAQAALRAFPAHAAIIQEALDLRMNSTKSFRFVSPQARDHDLFAFMEVVIATGSSS